MKITCENNNDELVIRMPKKVLKAAFDNYPDNVKDDEGASFCIADEALFFKELAHKIENEEDFYNEGAKRIEQFLDIMFDSMIEDSEAVK